mgnify:CR=1 FL=1
MNAHFTVLLLLVELVLQELSESFETTYFRPLVSPLLTEDLFSFNFLSVSVEEVKGVHFVPRVRVDFYVPHNFPKLVTSLLSVETYFLLDTHVIINFVFAT